jgi:hypothetical protein
MKLMNIKMRFTSYIKKLFKMKEYKTTFIENIKIIEEHCYKTNQKKIIQIFRLTDNEWKQTFPRS